MEKVLYEELFPDEFAERIKKMPVAFLPLGTLEWHGPHMPLGADGIQSKELFIELAGKMGGVVLPMLFVGPDRVFDDRGELFYGMDINTSGALKSYPAQRLTGSAYWLDTELFKKLLMSIVEQLSRTGVKIIIGHGHGPSINAFANIAADAQKMYGVKLYTAWSFAENEELKFKERRRTIGEYGDAEIHDVINKTLSNDYIPVQKVKDIIEELEEELEIMKVDNMYGRYKEYGGKTKWERLFATKYGMHDALQELLEGRK